MNMPANSSLLQRTLIATALASVCMSAFADTAIERIRQRGKLVAGVNHVVPPYVGGAKFRTPEGMETALAEELAKRLKVTLTSVRAEGANGVQLLAAGKADVVLTTLSGGDSPDRSATIVPTGYSGGPMAVMPTNTNIRTWEQLKGRPVCISEKSLYAGTIAARYGAIEKTFKAPADSLLALRTGQCDAAVHDSTMLNELIRLPEWKKFSARLPAGPSMPLVFVVPAGDVNTAAYLRQLASEWQSSGYLNQLITKTARQIAFEVYLDQDAPDCH
jgi:polar amino acid transport system substrate-binding protein